ncbi:zinc finger protein ush isoform X1 [Neocloeon triangulifer]|uniref:zinc finger protein ush isoform X1 n=1 Tax=Neocloeon triangulifer TaxID=2078957 RepID=UPI00286F99D7|nr:zinc finger protein ush isoform X1 [Neocloeon triangulifer]
MVLKFGRKYVFVAGEDFWNEGDGENATTASQQSPSTTEAAALGSGEDADGQDNVKVELEEMESKDEEDDNSREVSSQQPSPKLKLNTNLATDPALRNSKEQQDTSSDRSSPGDEQRFKPDISMLPASLFPAGPSPAAAIFCLPAVPETNSTASATTPRLNQENLETPSTPLPPPRLANCYMCQPCGIKFSSKSTLEAHQTYYCSHRASAAPRPSSPATPIAGKDGSDTELGSPRSSNAPEDDSAPPPAKVARTGRQYTCPHCSYSADKKVSLNRHMRMHTPSVTPLPVSPAPTAPSDSEAADESSASGSQLPPPAMDRYCANCDIRFSSVRTFKAHKAHYCDTRHVVKPNAAVSPAAASQASSGPDLPRVGSASSPTSSPAPAQPYLALPTNPMLLVPYQLVQAASFVTSAALPPGVSTTNPGACLLLVNGTVQPLVLPAVTERLPSPTPPPAPPRRTHQVEKTPVHAIPTPQAVPEVATNGGGTFPLDLSLPRSAHPPSALSVGSTSPRLGAQDPEDEKENRGLNTSSPSQGSSRASSPSSASPRPSRVNGVLPVVAKKPDSVPIENGTPLRKTPNLMPHIKLPKQLLVPELLGPLLSSQLALLQRPMLTAAEAAAFLPVANHAVPPAPQILVKQGVSRCEECNIVFLKVENFEVHKKYYCSARARSEGNTSPEEAKATSTPSPTPPQTTPTPPGKVMQQYICAPCGIKFTAIKNLKAHQAYYCLKRDVNQQANCTNNNEPPVERKKCPKCKVILPGDGDSPHHCMAVSHPVTSLLSPSGWRCPCCSTHLPTATAAQKHLEENHTGMLKGFRCTICSYRGNTLRGMRTHIRMHLLQAGADNKTCAEVKEEDFITCVLQDEQEGKESGGSLPILVEADEAEERPEQHPCNLCGFTGASRSVLLKHLRVVHRQDENCRTESPEALVVKLEPCEEKISLTEGENKEEEEEEGRRCQACDTVFNRDLYLTHKKYYCKAIHSKIRASVSPPSPTVSIKTPPTPVSRPEASART